MTYYQVLGLTKGATTSEIKTRYRALAKRHHPDINANSQLMSRINEAYGVLSDPLHRFKYDQSISSPSSSKPIKQTEHKSAPNKTGYYAHTPKKEKQLKSRFSDWKFRIMGSGIAVSVLAILFLALTPQTPQHLSLTTSSHQQNITTGSASNAGEQASQSQTNSQNTTTPPQNLQNTQASNLQSQSLYQQGIASNLKQRSYKGDRLYQQLQQCLSKVSGALNQQALMYNIIAIQNQIVSLPSIMTNTGGYTQQYIQLENELHNLQTQYDTTAAAMDNCYRS